MNVHNPIMTSVQLPFGFMSEFVVKVYCMRRGFHTATLQKQQVYIYIYIYACLTYISLSQQILHVKIYEIGLNLKHSRPGRARC